MPFRRNDVKWVAPSDEPNDYRDLDAVYVLSMRDGRMLKVIVGLEYVSEAILRAIQKHGWGEEEVLPA